MPSASTIFCITAFTIGLGGWTYGIIKHWDIEVPFLNSSIDWWKKSDLIFPTSSLIDAFNDPRDCVRNMFKDTLNTNVFKKPALIDNEDNPSIEKEEVFSDLNTNKPSIGCLLFNSQQDKQFRVELAFIKENKGYVWMFGSRRVQNYNFNAAREIIFTKDSNDKWKASKAQEVLLFTNIPKKKDTKDQEDKKFEVPVFNEEITKFSRDMQTGEKCNSDNCEYKEIKAYWKNETNGAKPLKDLSSNIGKWVLFLSDDEKIRKARHKSSYRQNVYLGSEWYLDLSKSTEERILIDIDKSKWESLSGVWKDTNDLCTEEPNNEEDKKHFCGPKKLTDYLPKLN